ncbi:MAG: hypothetical protein ACK4E7_05450 [Permianibacter sp.]
MVALIPFLMLLATGYPFSFYSVFIALGFLLPAAIGVIHTQRFVRNAEVDWLAFAFRWLSLVSGVIFFVFIASVRVNPPTTTGDPWLLLMPLSAMRIGVIFALSVEEIESGWRKIKLLLGEQ